MTTVMQPNTPVQSDQDLSQMFVFLGLALTMLGAVAIASSLLFTITTVLVIGGVLVAAGIAELIHAFRARKQQKVWLNVLSGLVYMLAGVIILWNPLFGALSLTLVMAAFLIAAGIVRIVQAVQRRKVEPAWGWFLVGGLLNLALGAIIALGWPISGLWVIGLFVGIEMLMHGIAVLALSSMVRQSERRDVPA